MEEREEELAMEEAALEDVQQKIDLRMEAIDLNEIVGQELFNHYTNNVWSVSTDEALKDTRHLDNGELVYTEWLKVGRTPYFADKTSFIVSNESTCDAIVFVRQAKAPFMERAYYLRAGRTIEVQDDKKRNCVVRIYPGTGWVDSLVVSGFDQILLKEGVPEETKDQMPANTALKGHFMFPAKSLWNNLQPVEIYSNLVYYNPNNTPVLTFIGDHNNIEYKKPN